MLADSDYFIDLMGGAQTNTEDRQRRAFVKGCDLHEDGIYLRVPTPVIYELYYGIGFVTNTPEELRKVQNVLMAHPTVDLSEQAAKKAGRVLGEIEHQLGTPGQSGISQTDACVGALAIICDEPVLTRNQSDYQQMSGVTIEPY